jgi:hypothetical protein
MLTNISLITYHCKPFLSFLLTLTIIHITLFHKIKKIRLILRLDDRFHRFTLTLKAAQGETAGAENSALPT